MIAPLAIASLWGCLQEPTPHLARPEGLEPIRAEATAAEPARDAGPEQATAGAGTGALLLGAIVHAVLPMLQLVDGSGDEARPDLESSPLAVLAVAGNTRGEVNLCDCRRNPRGGLARRSTALGAVSAEVAAGRLEPIVVDVGDTLSAMVGPPPEHDDADSVARAQAIIASLAAMRTDALLVNVRDLHMGRERLSAAAAEAGLPLVSSNLVDVETRRPAFRPSLIIKRGAVRVGLVGITPPHRTEPLYLLNQGMDLEEGEAAIVRELASLRRQKVDVVVLLSGLGVPATAKLLEEWSAAEPPPDLVLVSGTARLTREPQWAGGVAVLEPGDRGRQLLVVHLYGDEAGKMRLRRDQSSGRRALVELTEDLRRLSQQADAVGRFAEGGLGSRIESLHRDIRRSLVRIDKVTDEALRRVPPQDVPPTFDVQMLDLPDSLVPNANVQSIVDRVETETVATGAAPGKQAPSRRRTR